MKTIDQLFKVLIIFIISFLSFNTTQAQFKVIGYLPNWGNFINDANNLDHDKLTHVNISFINPTNASGDLGPTTNLTTVVGILHSHGLKVLASIGGATGSTYYNTLLATPSSRTDFVEKLKQLSLDYDLDGIDVDLEGSAVNSYYEPFVLELRDSMEIHGKLTTAAVGTWYSNRITDNALAAFDFINIMTYDQTGSWAPNTPGQHSSYDFAVSDLTFWGNRGLTPDRMILGVPFYGYSFGGGSGSYTWTQVTTNYPESIYNDEIYPVSGRGIYYNGIITIQKKTKLALAQAGGIMIWQMAFDTHDATSLLTAIDNIIQDNGTNIAPTTSITSPTATSTFDEASDINITADAIDNDGTIIKVEFYANDFKIGEDYTAPYSITWNTAGGGDYDITSIAYDNLSAYSSSSPITITVTDISAPAVYGGTIWDIPGKIEVEDFNWGPNGTSYYDNSADNNGNAYRATDVDIEHCIDNLGGGYSIGWTTAGEWLEYDINITESNSFSIETRIASNANTTRNYHIEIDGINVSGTISTAKTNGWQTWKSVYTDGISLTQGQKKMRIVFDNGDLNMNYVKFSISTNTTIANTEQNTFNIYPNPCTNSITIEGNQANLSNAQISIIDQLNRELISIHNNELVGKTSQTISTTQLPSGIYFCKIKTDEGFKTLKFIKN